MDESTHTEAAEEVLTESVKSSKTHPESTLLIAISILLGFGVLSFAYVFVEMKKSEAPVVIDSWALPSVSTTTVYTTPEDPVLDPLPYDGEFELTTDIRFPSNSKYRMEYGSIYYGEDSYENLGLDKDTFEYVGDEYVKDKDFVYFEGKQIYGANPTLCTKENLAGCRAALGWKTEVSPYALEVTWNDEKLIAGGVVLGNQCRSDGYVVGTVRNGALAGSKIVAQSEDMCDMWCGGRLELDVHHFIQFKDYVIPISAETGFSIKDIDAYSEKIAIPNSNYFLKREWVSGFFEASPNDEFLFTYPEVGNIYRNQSACFRSERNDHAQVEYTLELPFIDSETGTLNMTLLDGSKNTESYGYNPYYGSCLNMVDEETVKPTERLRKIGQFSTGDAAYVIANPQDQDLLDLYNDKNTLASYEGGTNKYSYEEYLSYYPYIYWQDPFGDWVEFLNKRFETAAEKCKPVIYLYPERTGNYSVYVKPNAGFTHTIPEYGTGWHVTATPDSQITDTKSGKTYPYLYWAGINTGIPEITEGWIISKNTLETFFTEKLSQLGLSEKEINDFNEYWVTRLNAEKVDQYKIMFVPQEQFERLAPLTVVGDEVPRHTIRVMMYAQPAEKDETLPVQSLPVTPKRDGFTVVEWGGALLN